MALLRQEGLPIFLAACPAERHARDDARLQQPR